MTLVRYRISLNFKRVHIIHSMLSAYNGISLERNKRYVDKIIKYMETKWHAYMQFMEQRRNAKGKS